MLSRRLRSVTTLRWNLVSNLLGNVWTALLAFALLPVIIRFLGVQQYGLIGFFTSLQALVILFDAGMSTTLNRWLARLSRGGLSSRDAGHGPQPRDSLLVYCSPARNLVPSGQPSLRP